MTSCTEDLRRLLREKRGKGRLDPAAAREAIGISKSEGLNGGDPLRTAGGITSPLVETSNSGTYTLTSSDGLFVLETPQETTYIDDNGGGSSYVVKHKENP